MNDPINPYAVSELDSDTLEPIYFSGTLTRDDLRVSLLNAPPKTGRARISTAVWMALVVVAFTLLCLALARGQRIDPVVFFGASLLFIGPWVSFLNFCMPGNRARARRVEISAKNQKPFVGWLDETNFVTTDQRSALVASWAYFGPVFIFPTHLLLPAAVDSGRRITLPWHFFESPGDVRRVCSFLKSRLGVIVIKPPNDATLASIMAEGDNVVYCDADSHRRLSSENWPFETDSAGESSFEVDLSNAMSSVSAALVTLCATVLSVIGYLLPIWFAFAVWIYQPDFPGERRLLEDGAGLFMIIFASIASIFAVFMLVVIMRAMLRMRGVQKQPFRIAFRDAGVHVAHDTYQSWFRWPLVMGAITEEKTAGWIVAESEEEVRIRRACFSSAEQFESFKAAIVSHFPL